jgi:hypothetical protein
MLLPNAVAAEFFHTAAGTAFVDLLINGHQAGYGSPDELG